MTCSSGPHRTIAQETRMDRPASSRMPTPKILCTRLVVESKEGSDETARLSWKQVCHPDRRRRLRFHLQHERSVAVLAANGIERVLLTPEQARHGGSRSHVDTNVLWRSGAGVIDAETKVTILVDLAVAKGGAAAIRVATLVCCGQLTDGRRKPRTSSAASESYSAADGCLARGVTLMSM